MIPNKLGRAAQSELMAPTTTALIALRLGRADSEHYHALACAMTIGYRAAEAVQRHRPLLPELQPALDALNAIFNRAKQRTVPDAPWSGTADEVDQIENGVKLYEGIMRATPPKVIRRVIMRVMQADAASAPRA